MHSSEPTASPVPGAVGHGPAAGGGTPPPPTADQIRETLRTRFVCPFCGSVNESEQAACPRCTMENTAAARKATKARIGPWYVLQTRNPAAPGMRFETLLAFVRKGKVRPRSVVRGPTTHQLWRFAAQVKGLSREFGICYSCAGTITAGANICPQCNRLQDAPPNPDALLEGAPVAAAPAPAPAPPPPPAPASNVDLAADENEFVIPALGGGSDESLAGFSLAGSMAGVTVDPAWARIDTPGARHRTNGNGASHGAPGQGGAASGYGTPSSRREGRRSEPVPTPDEYGHGEAAYGSAQVNDPEGFLSPKELAAAFNLDFKPGREPAPRGGGGDVGIQLPGSLRDPDARRRSGIGKLLLLLLLLVGMLYGAAILIDDTFRRDSFEWFGRMKQKIMSAVEAEKPPVAAAPTTKPARKNQPAEPDQTGRFRPVPLASAAPATRPTTPTAAPATRPADLTASLHPAPVTPPPFDVSLDPSPAAPHATPPAPHPATRPAEPPPRSTDDMIAETQRLYQEAIMAERGRDYATAVARYEKILTFPPEARQSDVEVRLRIAKYRVGGGE